MDKEKIMIKLVKIALATRDEFGQDAYNFFYEKCKEEFAEDKIDFANSWSFWKREVWENGRKYYRN